MFRTKVKQHVLKKKPSLSTLLHETLKRQWDEIGKAIKQFSYFNDWPEAAFHQCCVHSNILFYAPDEIIYVKDDANVDVTHFILEGTVQVIQRLILERHYSRKYKKWNKNLYKDQSVVVLPEDSTKLQAVYMQICKLGAGACFGIGEKLSKNIIIASTEVKCLVVPKSIILRNKTPFNVWERIIITMDMNTPTLRQVYREYKEGRERLKWQRNLYKSRQYGVYDRIPVNTTIHDAPLTLRSTSVLYANKFKSQARNDPMYLIGEKKSDDTESSNRPRLEDLLAD